MTTAKDKLVATLDEAVLKLLQEVDPSPSKDDNTAPTTVGEADEVPIGLADRVKAIELGIKWVAVKNKVDTGDNEDEFGRLRRGHVGGTRKRGAPSAPSTSRPNGDA